MDIKRLLDLVKTTLSDFKAQDVVVLNVMQKTSTTDYMIVASGFSTRHVKAIARNVALEAKKTFQQVFNIEGEESGEWVLVDLNDIVLHVMIPEARQHYSLEKLWESIDIRDEEKLLTNTF